MFQAAAATTVTLGWWQFDSPNGHPDEQGWTKHDLTVQIAKHFHVAGSPGGCDAITPIGGTKSIWCGQWPTTADPWCGWEGLPGYGDNWSQRLESTVSAASVSYEIAWESEPGYDFTYVEWWDPANSQWREDPNAHGGTGGFDGSGGPLTETLTSPYGATKVRFRFASDGAWSDEDGLWPTAEGAVKIDDISLGGGPVEDWEGEACGAQQSTDGKWTTTIPAGFGNYAALHHGSTIVQEDPCFRQNSWLWGLFDDPAITNYGCGGWPLQGAIHYPEWDGLYLGNEIWSPSIPISGLGGQYILEFLTYRDLPLDNVVFYVWHVRSRDNDATGCATEWQDENFVYYGGQKDWIRRSFDFGGYVNSGADEVQVSLGAVDYCGIWGWDGCGCHSHAPLNSAFRFLV